MEIRIVDINELDLILDVLNQLPEFENGFEKEDLIKRLNNTERIMLIAEFAGKPIGCKVAYNRYFDGSIYSWLGGVLPPFRNVGVATLLLEQLEVEARKRFLSAIRFKTRNNFSNMLAFSIKRGFYIIGFEKNFPISDSRIELQKDL